MSVCGCLVFLLWASTQGFHDEEYKQRRLMIADIARQYRM